MEVHSKSSNQESSVAQKSKNKNRTFAFACAILGSMTSILSGYDIGVMSGAAIFIQEELKISDLQLELVVGTINIYSLVGSGLAGRTSDLIGRKYTVVLACAIFFASALMMGFAVNYALLMAGRFIAGVAVGYAVTIAPLYTSELAPSSCRGFLSSFPEIFINTGMLLGFVSNYAFHRLPLRLGWRCMLGVGTIPAMVLALLVLLMPESPRWLVLKGRLGDAKRVLLKTSDSEEEAQSRLLAIQEAAGIPLNCRDEIVKPPKVENGHEAWKDLYLHPTPAVRRIIIAAVGLHVIQQACGIEAVVLYSPRIFKKAGIVNQSRLLAATVAVGCVKTCSVLIATCFSDKFGRRKLLLTSVGGMIVAESLLASGLMINERNPEKVITWAITLSITMVYCFVFFFSMGLGPTAWVYGAEVFPLKLRAQGAGLGAATNRLVAGITGSTFLSMTHKMTTGGSFLFFACFCVLSWIFIFTFLPETKGKNLEDIEALFTKSKDEKKPPRHNRQVQLENTATTV